MIEELPDMPAGVTGLRVSGRITADDLRELKPRIESLLQGDEVRIVEVIASDYAGFGSGGLVQDMKLGFGALLRNHAAFKRIAVVSDLEWVAHAMHAFAWLVPGELEVFGLEELDRATTWAAG